MRLSNSSPFPWAVVSAAAGVTILIAGLSERQSTDRILVILALIAPFLFSLLRGPST